MEKEIQSDSIATITLKPDYPPSEIYSSEPPPAYHRGQSSVVQVTKIIAVSVVLLAFILGGFILASAYITANASYKQSEHKLESLSADTDALQAPLAPKALVQEKPQRYDDLDEAPENEESDNSVANSDSEYLIETLKQTPVYIKLNFDDLASLQKDDKRINCTIDKKQIEDSSNYEKSKDGGIIIACENENIQKQTPPEATPDEENFTLQVEMLPITRLSRQLIPQMRPMFLEMHEPNPFPQIPQVLNQIVQEIISQNIDEPQPPKPEFKKPEQPETIIRQKLFPPPNVMVQMSKSPEQNTVTMIAHKYAKIPIERKAPMSVETENEMTPDEIKFIAPEIDAILADLQSHGGLLHQIGELPKKMSDLQTHGGVLHQIGELPKKMPDLQSHEGVLHQIGELPKKMPDLQFHGGMLHPIGQLPKKMPKGVVPPPPPPQQPRENVQEMRDAQPEFTNAVPMRLPLHAVQMGASRSMEMGVFPFEDLKL